MKTIFVRVTQVVKVDLDETKFTPEFMAEFAGSISDFDCIEQHAEHIGQLAAREVYSFSQHNRKEFVEGYGPIGDFGIVASVIETEIEHAAAPEEFW